MRRVGAALIAMSLSYAAAAAQPAPLDAAIFPVHVGEKSTLGNPVARVQAATIASLVDRIYASIKTPDPARPIFRLPLENVTLASLRRWVRDNGMKASFTELVMNETQPSVAGAGGKTPRPALEIIPTTNDAAFQSGRHYELMVTRAGYEPDRQSFQVDRRGTEIILQFGNSTLAMAPWDSGSIGFVVDASGASSGEADRKELRTAVGKALEAKHHKLRWFEDESFDALINRPASPFYNVRTATINAPPSLPEPPHNVPLNLRYVIELSRR